MSSALHKLDLRTLSVTLRQPPEPAGSGLGEQTQKSAALQSVILEVTAGKEVVLLQVAASVEVWRRVCLVAYVCVSAARAVFPHARHLSFWRGRRKMGRTPKCGRKP